MADAGALSLTFLGHQGWLVQAGDATVAFDPVLEDSFGHSPGTDFRVYPARQIDPRKMPTPDAVFLSHEHLDHFHLPSLARLHRQTPIYVGSQMPRCVVTILEEMGFPIVIFQPGQIIGIRDIDVIPFAAGKNTVVWESRVNSFYIRLRDHPEVAVFNAVDALISEQFISAVHSGALRSPEIVILANNSQIVPPGGVGSQSNLFELPEAGMLRHPGLSLLYGLVAGISRELPSVPKIAICGNGFVNMAKPYGPFLYSDNIRIAEIINELSNVDFAIGVVPGDVVSLDERKRCGTAKSSFVTLDEPLNNDLLLKRTLFMQAPTSHPPTPISEFAGAADAAGMLAKIQEALNAVLPALLVSPTGRCLIETNEHLCGPLGPLRALFRFVHGDQSSNLAVDIAQARMVAVDVSAKDALHLFPMGVELPLCDFYAVVTGELQIWDVAACSLRGWYLGSKYENLTAFLFSAFGEQARPDLALKIYRSALSRIAS